MLQALGDEELVVALVLMTTFTICRLRSGSVMSA
jgi:hypothetical protein